MKVFSYVTPRLICRPLTVRDNVRLQYVVTDESIQKYFSIGTTICDVTDFIENIIKGNEVNVGLFLKDSKILIGSITGYRFSSTELLVEFFIDQSYRRDHLMREALSEFVRQCHINGYEAFTFWVEPGNEASKGLLKYLGARHFDEDRFVDNNRTFDIYRICY